MLKCGTSQTRERFFEFLIEILIFLLRSKMNILVTVCLYNTQKINFAHLLAENLENIFKSKEGIIPRWSVLTLKC